MASDWAEAAINQLDFDQLLVCFTQGLQKKGFLLNLVSAAMKSVDDFGLKFAAGDNPKCAWRLSPRRSYDS